MKAIYLFTLLSLSSLAGLSTGCHTTQAQKQQTLAAVGLSAKLVVDSSAILLADGKITVAQFEKVAKFYDTRFQPAFRFALVAVNSDTTVPAPLHLVALLSELQALAK